MALNLKGRSFLTLEDFTPGEIRYTAAADGEEQRISVSGRIVDVDSNIVSVCIY